MGTLLYLLIYLWIVPDGVRCACVCSHRQALSAGAAGGRARVSVLPAQWHAQVHTSSRVRCSTVLRCDCNGPFIRIRVDGCSEKLDSRTERTSVVHSIFGGYLQSSVACAACSYASNTFDPFLNLSLEVKHCTSINDALIHFTKPEILDASNMYKCEKYVASVCFITRLPRRPTD